MKEIIKYVARQTGRLCACFCPLTLFELIRAVGSHFYTGMVSRRFAAWGDGSLIARRATALVGLNHISIGEHTEIDRHVRLTAWDNFRGQHFTPEIRIGSHCHIGSDAHITAVHRIVIGDNLLTGTNVLISDNAHGQFERSQLDLPPEKRPLFAKGEVIIGDNVWLGNNVCILSGVHIGDGVIVAANSVVTHDIPAYSVAAGAPAKIVKQIIQ